MQMQKALAVDESGGLFYYHKVMELVFFSALNKSAQLQLLETVPPASGKVNSLRQNNRLFSMCIFEFSFANNKE